MNTRGYFIASTLTAVCAVGATVAIGPSAVAAARAPSTHVPAAPLLGMAHSYTRGLGATRPKTVDFGGDPTSYVSKVRWFNWGGRVATGTGIACRPPANGPIALCKPTVAKVKAFGLGSCSEHGRTAYTRVEWWFPVDGKFNSHNNSVFNTCTAGVE